METIGLSNHGTAASVLKDYVADEKLWITAAVVGAAVIAFSVLQRIYGEARRARSGRGGPVMWPVFGTIVEMRRNFDTMNDWFLGYFSEDVQTWRLRTPSPLSQNMIATVDPVNVEYMLTNIQKYGKGGASKFRLEDFLGSGIFMSNGDAWRRHRKIASSEFSTRKLREHSNTVFREDAIKLANALKQAMAAHKSVDFQDLAQRMTLDSICKVAFGVDLGGISSSLPDVPFATAFDAAQNHLVKRLVDPLFRIQKLLNVGAERRYRKAVDKVDQFAYKVIAQRREEIAQAHNAGHEFDREDLLSKFMAPARRGEDNYGDKELRDVTVDFLLAGRDTTASALAWFMYDMCNHPELGERIYKEGVDVVGKHADFESTAKHLTPDNLGRMHYLHAALSETLRLHPPVPKNGKTALTNDVLPDGTVVKEGDIVFYVPYSMGRMPFIWGSDALEMKPERWLDSDGVFHPVSPFKFTTFQAGPRICLGRDSAFLQLKVTLALIIHFFTFQVVPGQELTYGSALVMPMKNGIQVTMSPRQ